MAYARISARDLIYSASPEERGKDCGKIQTLFLKVKRLTAVMAVLVSSTSPIIFRDVLKLIIFTNRLSREHTVDVLII